MTNIILSTANVLKIQSALIDRSSKKWTDDFSIGYVWGFIDGMLQKGGINSDAQQLVVIDIVLSEIFGKDLGRTVLRRGLDLQKKRYTKFMGGMMTGGQECFNWNEDRPPLGWAGYANGP
jgi:hypothetical protein